MSVLEKVLERLATSDKSTIVVERQPGQNASDALGMGKVCFCPIRCSNCSVGGCLHVVREGDPPIPAYDPYGPGDESEGLNAPVSAYTAPVIDNDQPVRAYNKSRNKPTGRCVVTAAAAERLPARSTSATPNSINLKCASKIGRAAGMP
jgi:hypothetical protein